MATIVSPVPSRLPMHKVSGLWAHAWKVAVLLLLAIWVLVVGAAHEPWFDEAQAWLLARDSSFYELLAQRVRYEGSPGLWHVILWIAIRAGLPYSQLYLISGSCAIAGAAVVLWRAPFPPWMRVGIVFSYFFAYQYSVVARSYSADLVVVPVLAVWFPQRVDNPIRYAFALGLLANLNAHSFVAAAPLGLDFAWQLFKARKLKGATGWTAIGAAGALGLLALLCAWQPADNHFVRTTAGYPLMFLNFVRHAFVDRLLVFSTHDTTATDAISGFIVTVVALRPSIKLIASAQARVASIGAIVALVLFSIKFANPWHSGLLYLFWVFGLWVSWPSTRPKLTREVLAGFAIIAGAQTVETVTTGVWEIHHVYSPGASAAQIIARYRASHPGARVAAFGFKSFAVQPYAPVNQFANYKGGAPNVSWLDWRRGEPWNPIAGEPDWEKLLDGRPDMIVASLAHFDGKDGALMPAACKAGYVETHHLVGELNWRGAHYEDDSLAIFERGSPQDCGTEVPSAPRN